jgi:hypothetical protein
MNNLPPVQTWQTLYREALGESDPQNLSPIIMATVIAIFWRLHELKQAPDGQAEWRAIDDALRVLRMLQVDKLALPQNKSTMIFRCQ